MPTGVVKWFNDQKGFGFIRMDGLDEDIMVHYSAIQMEGFKTLPKGMSVDFKIKKDEKGLKAVDVRKAAEQPVP